MNKTVYSPKITYFIRKMAPGAFSINQAFGVLAEEVSQSRSVYVHHLKRSGAHPAVLFANILESKRVSGQGVCHITGDVHYLALGLKRGCTVLTIHDCVLLAHTSRWSLKFYIYRWFWYRMPVRRAAIVTTISEKSKNEIVEHTGCNPGKIKVIPNFFNEVYQFQAKTFNKTCPRILHIGLFPNKNLERVAAALEGVSCILEIIGELQLEHRELLHRHNITFESCANISLEDMAKRYRESDMLVFASTYEGFGLPVIEAQATGRPVVTSNIAPLPWVAGEAGACFVDPFDRDAIRAGILRIINDDGFRNSLVRNGLENIRRFRLQEISRQYLAVYDELIQKKCAE